MTTLPANGNSNADKPHTDETAFRTQLVDAAFVAGSGVGAVAVGALASSVMLGVAFGVAGALAFAVIRSGKGRSAAVVAAEPAVNAWTHQLEQLVRLSPFNIALYSKDDVLLICSERYEKTYASFWADLPKPVRYQDLLRATAISNGLKHDSESYVQDRLKQQHDGDNRMRDRQYPDGSWIRVGKIKLADGSVAGFGADITELRHSEVRLEETNRQLQAFITEQLPTAITDLGKVSHRLQRASTDVTSLSGDSHSRIDSLASTAEEMSASIHEISRSSADASFETTKVSSAAKTIEVEIARLEATLDQIGDFAKTISSIAGQTNLLALNATIEAARAGEAGRGFSVVASEVKQLAEQSGRASQEIGAQLQVIQSATKGVVGGIAGMVSDVQSIAARISTIASASSQQAAASHQVNLDLSALVKVAIQTGDAAKTVIAVASDAEQVSRQLRQSVQDAQSKVA